MIPAHGGDPMIQGPLTEEEGSYKTAAANKPLNPTLFLDSLGINSYKESFFLPEILFFWFCF